MLSLHHMPSIKQALFTNFLDLKCYDLQSHSLLIFIWLVRFLSELTVVNFSSLVNDSSFAHLAQLYDIMAIYGKGDTPKYFIEEVGVLILMCVLFLWMMFSGMEGESRHIKLIGMKVFGLLVYGFRVFVVKNLADVAYRGYKQGNVALLILLATAITLICVISVLL